MVAVYKQRKQGTLISRYSNIKSQESPGCGAERGESHVTTPKAILGGL